MALKKCKDCRKEYSDDSAKCIHCGANNPKNVMTQAITALLFVVLFLWLFVFGGFDFWTESSMDDIYQQVAKDAEEQFRISLTGEDKIQICVQAGLVSAAHLQAKNGEEYRRWKQLEDRACAVAGIPRQ